MSTPIFQSVEVRVPDGNTFDLTHDVKMSGKMGKLLPCMMMDVVPGDKVNIAADILIRFAPMIAPIMHRVDATVHYFFCPNRLVWESWQDFITNVPTGEHPYIVSHDGLFADYKKFLDYMGVPPCPPGGTPEQVNALPFAAYQMIYNEYYRDQNLSAEVAYKLIDGDNSGNTDLFSQRFRAWEHDYFTSNLPWAQKGSAVDLPLGAVELNPLWSLGAAPEFVDPLGIHNTGPVTQATDIEVAGLAPQAFNPNGSLIVSPTTINDLRTAFRLQEWLEKNARGGSRYIENILMHFGVRSSDARLQRPEYITGTKAPVVISEVLNTTGENAGLPQGNMAGHGVSVGKGYVGSYYAEEHGWIIGILSVMPKTAYQQGINRNMKRTDPTDYYWPSFANLGEQEVIKSEIYAYDPLGAQTFGYVPRNAEYKYIPSRVAGDFRSTLNYWHLGRIFDSIPSLNQEFIELNPEDVERIFAVNTTEDNLYIHILNKIIARRPMPVFGTPML